MVVGLHDSSRGREPRFEEYLNADVRAEAEAYVDGYVLPNQKRSVQRSSSKAQQRFQNEPEQGVDDRKSPLAGSVLSPNTWRQAVAAVRDKTVRS